MSVQVWDRGFTLRLIRKLCNAKLVVQGLPIVFIDPLEILSKNVKANLLLSKFEENISKMPQCFLDDSH